MLVLYVLSVPSFSIPEQCPRVWIRQPIHSLSGGQNVKNDQFKSLRNIYFFSDSLGSCQIDSEENTGDLRWIHFFLKKEICNIYNRIC